MKTAVTDSLEAEVHLVEQVPSKRLAFRLSPPTIRALVPAQTCGTYLLLQKGEPIYVGRSDACLRTRLAKHNHRSHATHVLWESAQTPKAAYVLEAYWFHRHSLRLNQVHPASPTGQFIICPFCDVRLLDALQNAFPHIGHLN